MENYKKGEVIIVPDQADIPCMENNAIHMNVKHGSKIRNLMGYAMAKIKEPGVKQITWNGYGQAVMKAISCTEIMKRKVKNLFQVTQIRYKRVEEYWEPTMDGLERLKVNRDIPAITVLLSKDPLDESLPGYQPPGSFEMFWTKSIKDNTVSRSNRMEEKALNQSGSGRKQRKKVKKREEMNRKTQTGNSELKESKEKQQYVQRNLGEMNRDNAKQSKCDNTDKYLNRGSTESTSKVLCLKKNDEVKTANID